MSVAAELPPAIAAFDDAQRRAIALLAEVVAEARPGAAVADLEGFATSRAAEVGFSGWYHPPELRVGAAIGGGLRGRIAALRPAPLAEGDLLSVDLGPATSDAYGDVGVTVVVGGGAAPAVVEVARTCTQAACGYASRWKTVGEIHVFARAWAVNRRMDLAGEGPVGHRVLPREGVLASGFPRSAHLATLLARNRIHRLHPVRMQGMFAVRPVVRSGDGACAAFEEIVWIDGDQRRLLGRDSLEHAGRLG
jgi:hypothetical protein